MAPFDRDAELSQDVAYRLMTDAFVTLFWRPAVLDETLDWVTDHDYETVRVDASRWTTDLQTAFGFLTTTVTT